MILKNEIGFTLVEITIAMALLSTAIVGATVTFISLSNLHQKTIAVQDVQQQTRYVVESIQRDITNGSSIYEETGAGPDTLVIESGLVSRQEVRYYVDSHPIGGGQTIFRQLCSGTTVTGASCEVAAPMTSSDVTLSAGSTDFIEWYDGSSLYGNDYVTITLSYDKNADLAAEDDENYHNFELSTLVSIRN